MPGKINLYNLGAVGVDICSSPPHVLDGGLLAAQNAVSSPEDAQEGLRKRDGMVQLSTPIMSAPILAIHNIPAGS